MKIFCDTSVLVAALVEAHPNHLRAVEWLHGARAGKHELIIASHTLAELYSVLTRLPVRPRIPPSTAWRLIHTNLEGCSTIAPLSTADYLQVVKQMADRGLSGGIIYDALIAHTARRAEVARLLTFNAKDFRRVWPEGEAIIYEP